MFKRKSLIDRDSTLSVLDHEEDDGFRTFVGSETLPVTGAYSSEDEVIDREEVSGLLGMSEMDEEWSGAGGREAFEMEHKIDLEEPETVIGEGICIRGRLEFQRFLQIDGSFEGELVGEGKLVIGPSGSVTSDLNLKEATIEGKVFGDIHVRERLWLRDGSSVKGNIQARLVQIEEGARVEGHMSINPDPVEEEHALEHSA